MPSKHLLDIWCALNSSFGGPLLAIVTIGGFLAVGRSLVSFPDKDTGAAITSRNRNNRFRRHVFCLGIIVSALLLSNIFTYMWVFSVLRLDEKVCTRPEPTSNAPIALICFLLSTVLSSLFGVAYAKLFNGLKVKLGN
jgi:hypothetical protein